MTPPDETYNTLLTALEVHAASGDPLVTERARQEVITLLTPAGMARALSLGGTPEDVIHGWIVRSAWEASGHQGDMLARLAADERITATLRALAGLERA